MLFFVLQLCYIELSGIPRAPPHKAMLEISSTIRLGRYKITSKLADGPKAHLFEALDTLVGRPVLICMRPADPETAAQSDDLGERLRALVHPGVFRIQEHFYEKGSVFTVTEPVGSSENAISDAAGLKDIAAALDLIGGRFGFSDLLVIPETLRCDDRGQLRFAYFGPGVVLQARTAAALYFPLESIWGNLDLASQTAILKQFGDDAIYDLEKAPAFDSALYSLASSALAHIAGSPIAGPLERTIELLDGGADPIDAIASLGSMESFLASMMTLDRNGRQHSAISFAAAFPSVEMAAGTESQSVEPQLAEPEVIEETKVSVASETDELEDLDLLEIPSVADPVAAQRDEDLDPIPAEVAVVGAETAASSDVVHERRPVFEEREVKFVSKPEYLQFSDDLNSALEELDKQSRPESEPALELEKEPEIHVEPERSADPVVETYQHQTEVAFEPVVSERTDFKSQEPATAGSGVKIAIGAAAVLVLGLGGWGVMSLVSSGSNDQKPSIEATVSGASIPDQPQAAPTDAAIPADTTTGNDASTAENGVDPRNGAQPGSKVKPQVAEVKPNEKKPDPKADQKAEPKPAEKTKKKLTVDDLLNN